MTFSHMPLDCMITLPPKMVEAFEDVEQRAGWFASSDPAGRKLGSGGGAAHLLVEAWKKSGSVQSFDRWLAGNRKLLVQGIGGERPLPAYAPAGIPLAPMPVFRWAMGQSLTQTLLDLQYPTYDRVLSQAPSFVAVMIASGNVLLQLGPELPELPQVDVLGLGIWAKPEKAGEFGLFCCPRQRPSELSFFLQKPGTAKVRELAAEYLCLLDSGLWLLSQRAVQVLLKRCGWDPQTEQFKDGVPLSYSLYSEFGLSLGKNPLKVDAEIGALSSAVVALNKAEFYHFGGTQQLIESVSELQNLELDETKLGLMGAKRHPNQYLQNCHFEYPLRLEENHTLWAENSTIPATWRLACNHVLTGIPDNQWDLRLEPGVCLDFVPVGGHEYAIRPYGIEDRFQGNVDKKGTLWFDMPVNDWFAMRDIDLAAAGLAPDLDIQQAPLFPVLAFEDIQPRFLEWLFATTPGENPEYAAQWLKAPRLSADQIQNRVNLERLYRQRSSNREHCLEPMLRNFRWSVFLKLDLESTARLYAATGRSLPPSPTMSTDGGLEPMQLVRDHMFRAAVMRHRGQSGWEIHEGEAFSFLREMIVHDAQLSPVLPRCNVIDDQIVWGRSPVRLDLAGGWSDTPPFCLEHGGQVINVAVDLNGQPPIQVFAKLTTKPEIVLRSIDLGAEIRITRYEEIDTYAQPGHEFALAKAALALTGFLPRFHAEGGFPTLKAQLEAFGGGIEVTLLSAVPKGSGLGTSSILAATLLATLGDLCGLNWDARILFTRTLALEQMLTTGGGWQDQAGGLYRGIKLIETGPGLAQKPTLRWLPDYLFSDEFANKTILLYYTGLTRLAKNILHEIVRGIFLNSPQHLSIVNDIAANATVTYNAIQQANMTGLQQAIQNSWELNQRLDIGTNPPIVQAILNRVSDYVAGTKLLGAGGGGYLLMFAKDAEAGLRIRKTLQQDPPNKLARFVNLSLSQTGLQLTRS